MNAKITLLIALVLVVGCINAQDIKVPSSKDVNKATATATKQVTSKADLGTLVSQLTNNLSDKAFTSDFLKKKESFTKTTSGTTDAAGLSSSLQTLQGGLVPNALDKGWGMAKTKWLKDAKSANDLKSVAGLTQTLESHISPAVFKSDWQKTKPVWESALNTLAK
ncbi:MAG: hypothetical protein ABSD71_07850 [Bacteroidales bacterium]|jgi:hypothetical protein